VPRPRVSTAAVPFAHEPWCMTLNAEISYAYKIVMDPTALTVGDALILHSLGAAWSKQGCQGDCA
jgi:hypothetical protein